MNAGRLGPRVIFLIQVLQGKQNRTAFCSIPRALRTIGRTHSAFHRKFFLQRKSDHCKRIESLHCPASGLLESLQYLQAAIYCICYLAQPAVRIMFLLGAILQIQYNDRVLCAFRRIRPSPQISLFLSALNSDAFFPYR
jgi:hypothetical protein